MAAACAEALSMSGLSFDSATFLNRLINDPVAAATVVLAIATFVSAILAIWMPWRIEQQRESDLRKQRAREDAKAESHRQATLQMVAAVLNGLATRAAALRGAVASGGVPSTDPYTTGLNEMVSSLFSPNVCAALENPMLAARLYVAATVASQVLSDTQWIYQASRTVQWVNASQKTLGDLQAKLIDLSNEAIGVREPSA